MGTGTTIGGPRFLPRQRSDMGTQANKDGCYERSPSRRDAADYIKKDEDGMGTEGQKYYG